MNSAATPLPKLLRLEEAIRAEVDLVKRGCLRAERAGLLARQGSPIPAREALNALQIEFGRNPQAAVSIWVQIVEGWIAHYEGDLTSAKDRLKRAYALSGAIDDKNLRALSAAWLAHLAYAQDQFTEMAEYLKVSKGLAQVNDHLTQTRLSLVMAQAFHFSNRLDLAQPWYLKARNHALIEKDDAALSVLSYNMAGRRAFNLVGTSISSTYAPQESSLAATGIQASFNFDRLFGIPLLGSWVRIVQAMAYSADSKFRQSLNLYEANLEDALKTRLSDQIAFFKADMAWCHANLNSKEKAIEYANESRLLLNDRMYVEDKTITAGRLAQVYQLLDQPDAAQTNREIYLKAPASSIL